MVCVKACDTRLAITSFLVSPAGCHLSQAALPASSIHCLQSGHFISVLCLMTVIRFLKRIMCLRFS